MSSNIKVGIKFRPKLQKEFEEIQWNVSDNNIKSVNQKHDLVFENVFDENASTEEVYEVLAKPIVSKALEGYNGTILAYGLYSSGKTYNMIGDNVQPGIIPLGIKDIFKRISETTDREFVVKIGSVEIYDNKVYDLLDSHKDVVTIFETHGQVFIHQKEIIVSCEAEVLKQFHEGNKRKRTVETTINKLSSRSHSIFRVTVESQGSGTGFGDGQEKKISNLFFVDLASTENIPQFTLKKGVSINKKFVAIGRIIRELSRNAANIKQVNFRECKLTRILSPALGGNSLTAVICTVSPTALEETYHTMFFAQNAMRARTYPIVNLNNNLLIMKKEFQFAMQEYCQSSSSFPLNGVSSRRRKVTTPIGSVIDLAAPSKKPKHVKTSDKLVVLEDQISNVDSKLDTRSSIMKRTKDPEMLKDQTMRPVADACTIELSGTKEKVLEEKDQVIARLRTELNEAQRAVCKSRSQYYAMLSAKYDAIDIIKTQHGDELAVANQRIDELQEDTKLFEKALFDKETEFKLMEARAHAAEEGLIEMKKNLDQKFRESHQENGFNLLRMTKRIDQLTNDISDLKKREQEKKKNDLNTYKELEIHYNENLELQCKNFEEIRNLRQNNFEEEFRLTEIHFKELLKKKDQEIKLFHDALFKTPGNLSCPQYLFGADIKRLNDYLKMSLESLTKMELTNVNQEPAKRLTKIFSALYKAVDDIDKKIQAKSYI